MGCVMKMRWRCSVIVGSRCVTTVNPYTFAEPTSPHIISADEGRPIAAAVLSSGLRELEGLADWVLVEGAGGWFTPLSDSLTFADWAQAEQLPVILVVGVKLGCINHAMLTAQAVRRAGLPLAGWIANDVQPPGKRHAEYLATLKNRLAAPFLGEIPWLADIAQRDDLGQYLDLRALDPALSTAPAAAHPAP